MTMRLSKAPTPEAGPERLRKPPVQPLVALLMGLLVLLAACAAERGGEVYGTRDDQHRIANPSRQHARATGTGCADSERLARISAARVARYNLRSLTGAARYVVSVERRDTYTREDGQVCVEVEALASPRGF